MTHASNSNATPATHRNTCGGNDDALASQKNPSNKFKDKDISTGSPDQISYQIPMTVMNWLTPLHCCADASYLTMTMTLTTARWSATKQQPMARLQIPSSSQIPRTNLIPTSELCCCLCGNQRKISHNKARDHGRPNQGEPHHQSWTRLLNR